MSEFELRRDLKTLATERQPAQDLWAAIEARLQPAALIVPAAPRRSRAWPALAAGVLLAIGAGLVLRQAPPMTPAAPAGTPWSLREAQVMDASYRGALETAGPALALADDPRRPDWTAAGTELDAAQRELESALGQNPNAVFLLNRLKHTHEQRLRLVRRRAELS